MKTAAKISLSLLIIAATIFGMLIAWRNCSLNTYGEEPLFTRTIEEDGSRVFHFGELALPLPSLEEVVEGKLFDQYPALLPKSLRLFLGAAARRQELFWHLEQRRQDFSDELFGQNKSHRGDPSVGFLR